jgi:hypothetical protein
VTAGEIAATVVVVVGALIAFTLSRGMSAWRFWQDTVAPWLDRKTARTPNSDDDEPDR